MNEQTYVPNFRSGFLRFVEGLDFQQVDRNFQVIEQQNELFCPYTVAGRSGFDDRRC